jgi:hypothetical protein
MSNVPSAVITVLECRSAVKGSLFFREARCIWVEMYVSVLLWMRLPDLSLRKKRCWSNWDIRMTGFPGNCRKGRYMTKFLQFVLSSCLLLEEAVRFGVWMVHSQVHKKSFRSSLGGPVMGGNIKIDVQDIFSCVCSVEFARDAIQIVRKSTTLFFKSTLVHICNANNSRGNLALNQSV